MNLYNFFLDLKQIYIFRKNKYHSCFFFENLYTKNIIYDYYKNYNQNKKKCIISFIDLGNSETYNCDNVFQIRTKLLKEIFFLTINCRFLYCSTPNLNNSIFRKSIISNCKYIYLQHSPFSLTMIYPDKAFNHFDCVQAINTYQYNDLLEINEKFKTKIKIIKMNYRFLNRKFYRNEENNVKKILIAPSWGTDFYKKKTLVNLINILSNINFKIYFRPHQMSIYKKEVSKTVIEKLNVYYDDPKEVYHLDYDYIISDWSGIFMEYSIINKRKSILINTSKKIQNKKYSNYKSKQIEIESRKIFGIEFNYSEISNIRNYILNYNNEKKDSNEISNFYKKHFF